MVIANIDCINFFLIIGRPFITKSVRARRRKAVKIAVIIVNARTNIPRVAKPESKLQVIEKEESWPFRIRIGPKRFMLRLDE